MPNRAESRLVKFELFTVVVRAIRAEILQEIPQLNYSL